MFSVSGPMFVVSMVKVILPVGVPTVEVTVAVKVTDCPKVDGFGDEVSVVAVLALSFVRLKLMLVAPAALAVTLYEPAVPFAVTVVETAPLTAMLWVKGVVSVILAPDAGAVNEMMPPITGSAYALVTFNASGVANAVLIDVD